MTPEQQILAEMFDSREARNRYLKILDIMDFQGDERHLFSAIDEVELQTTKEHDFDWCLFRKILVESGLPQSTVRLLFSKAMRLDFQQMRKNNGKNLDAYLKKRGTWLKEIK